MTGSAAKLLATFLLMLVLGGWEFAIRIMLISILRRQTNVRVAIL